MVPCGSVYVSQYTAATTLMTASTPIPQFSQLPRCFGVEPATTARSLRGDQHHGTLTIQTRRSRSWPTAYPRRTRVDGADRPRHVWSDKRAEGGKDRR